MDAITAATIEETIKAGRIVEAKTLITMHESVLSIEERQRFTVDIEERQARAEAVIAQAEALEISGQTEEAKALYTSILDFAADYPGIEEHIKRTNEAVLLAKAVQRRNRRIRETSPTPAPQTAKKTLFPLIGAGLAVGLVLAGLVLVLTKPNSTPPPEKTASPAPALIPSSAAPPAPASQTQAVMGHSQERQPAAPPVKEKTTPPATTSPATQHPVTVPSATAAASSQPAPPEGTKPVQPTPNHGIAVEPEPSPPADTQRKPSDMYTVQPGDSLSLIADRQFCYEDYWKKIYQLNRDQITDPSKLHPGMVLRLTGIENRCSSPHN